MGRWASPASPSRRSWPTPATCSAKQFYFYVALGLAAFALYLSYRFVYSNAGRAAVTVRENRYVAQSVGIRPFSYAMRRLRARRDAGRPGGRLLCALHFLRRPEVFGFSFMSR